MTSPATSAPALGGVKRLFVGRPLRSGQLSETLLPKWLALPVFCSDPISSVAYATEEIVLVLAAGGAAYLAFSKWVATAVALLLVVVVLSYRQTCYAYPNGGGAFAVSMDNFGPTPALIAASALLVDYVMTVAVSIVSGVDAIISAAPSLESHAVVVSVGFVVLLVVANLRGVKESGKAFAVPTYVFVAMTFLMFGVALVRGLSGDLPQASTAAQQLHRTVHVGGAFTLLLTLRAFASGCTALTGVEAISNGVPSFRSPKSRNAALTLTAMGALAVSMFVGITVLALHVHAHAQPNGNPSVISQVADASFGHNALFFVYQAATAGILVLAANTAFNGFPVLSSILAQSRYLPRQLHNRGDRLVFSNGIILLGAMAIALVVGFDASIDKLIQLYIIGVFTSFTLSQAGMVRHWTRELADGSFTPQRQRRLRVARVINAVGCAATGLVLVIVLYTKVVHGAWLAILAMALLFAGMKGIRRHYDEVSRELEPPSMETTLPARNHAVVLVSRLHLPTLRAIAYARATRPSSLEAVTVGLDEEDMQRLRQEWEAADLPIPLVLLDSPYREIVRPVLEHVRRLRGDNPRDVVTVFIPEYVVGRWWEQLLHNQSALRLKARLLFEPGVMVTSVPWQLRSTAGRAEPVRPAA